MSDYLETNKKPQRFPTDNTITNLTIAIAELTANTRALLDSHKEFRDCVRLTYENNKEISTLHESFKQKEMLLQDLQIQLKVIQNKYLIHNTTRKAHIYWVNKIIHYGPSILVGLMTLMNVFLAIKEGHL